ncbi:DUF551 domain-containing protein [Klebsiella pneumoniae]|nr:DUF551 domain-containing protein [Klebsiella pneumoniae]
MAQIALAAMDSSESVELSLDYLQGHKDGLEWAARLAEANHPETGNWLYDDPVELAKAIRKGPDMPPVQSVADSEPDRNPVLAHADSYRDMAKQGVESVPIWSVITDLERNIAPLYRHAQQPVVPASQKEPISFDEWSRKCALQITLCYPDFREKAKYIWDSARETQQPAMVVPDELKEAAADFLTVLDEYPEQLVPINRDSAVVRALRAAMLAAAPQSPGSEPATVLGKWIPVSERMPEVGVKVLCFPAEDEPIHAVFNGQLWLQDVSWSASYEPIDNVIPITVTHLMQLPAGPQEVKGE